MVDLFWWHTDDRLILCGEYLYSVLSKRKKRYKKKCRLNTTHCTCARSQRIDRRNDRSVEANRGSSLSWYLRVPTCWTCHFHCLNLRRVFHDIDITSETPLKKVYSFSPCAFSFFFLSLFFVFFFSIFFSFLFFLFFFNFFSIFRFVSLFSVLFCFAFSLYKTRSGIIERCLYLCALNNNVFRHVMVRRMVYTVFLIDSFFFTCFFFFFFNYKTLLIWIINSKQRRVVSKAISSIGYFKFDVLSEQNWSLSFRAIVVFQQWDIDTP